MIPTAQSDCPLLTADFDYPLPAALIADRPTPVRSACRLLTLDSEKEAISHTIFGDLLNLLNPGDLLVLNNTQVIPARLLGHKVSGGRVEVLVERLLGQQQALVHIRASKAPKPGTQLILGNAQGQDNITTTVMARQDRLFLLQFNDPRPLLTLLEAIGQVPLPPYIHRPAQASDRTQYQTVYASVPGAVAAPTAGLHFDQPLLDALQAKGVESAYVTLHVGAGTFQPVQVTQIKDHLMHAEYVHVPAEVVNAVLACKARGKQVVAVGTSAVRALESAAQAAMPLPIAPFSGDTRLFIYPGYRYQIVDALITNFHLPCSTLLMLVSAFAGYSLVLKAYHEAITQRYRFFSYGDAMLITRGYRPTGLNQP